MCFINSGSILKFFRILVMYKCTYLYVYNARKIKQNISCFVCTFICTFDFNKTHGNMKKVFLIINITCSLERFLQRYVIQIWIAYWVVAISAMFYFK